MRRSPSIGRAEARATDATRGDSTAARGDSTAARGDSTAARGDSTAARGESASREWRVGEFQGRGDSTLHGVHSPGRVAARGVHSPRCGGPLGAARRPGRRSTRRGESTAASTCAAATSSAGPSYGSSPWSSTFLARYFSSHDSLTYLLGAPARRVFPDHLITARHVHRTLPFATKRSPNRDGGKFVG